MIINLILFLMPLHYYNKRNTGFEIKNYSMFLFSLDNYPEVELLDHMTVLFLIFLRRLHSVFCKGWINLQSYQHLLPFVFLKKAILTGVRYLTVVLVCISLRTKMSSTFLTPVGHLYVFFWKMSIWVFCPFFKSSHLFLCYWVA